MISRQTQKISIINNCALSQIPVSILKMRKRINNAIWRANNKNDYKCEQIIQQKIASDFQANFDSSPEGSESNKAKVDFMNTRVKRKKKNKDAFCNNRSLTNRNNQNSYNLVSQNKEDVKEANDKAENSKRSYSFTSPNNSFRIEAIESDRIMNEMGNIELALETSKPLKPLK